MRDDLIPVEEQIQRDKLDRKTDEALRLVKIYVDNRLAAWVHWHDNSFGRAGTDLKKVVEKDLALKIRLIARSLPHGHSLLHLMHSFADNLGQIWALPNPVGLVREMHRELDPHHESRSIVPGTSTESWRDWRYAGALRAW